MREIKIVYVGKNAFNDSIFNIFEEEKLVGGLHVELGCINTYLIGSFQKKLKLNREEFEEKLFELLSGVKH